jgi:RHS repeat-associated protein
VSRAKGTRNIDELVQMRVKDKGDLYVHQGERSERERAATGKPGEDARVRPATCPEGASTTQTTGGANWNVIALTDLGGSVVERYVYTPYGQVTVHQGERDQGGSVNAEADGDGDVDSTDKGTPGTTCPGTVTGSCRILDLDPALDPARRAKPATALRPFRRAACGGSRVHGDYDSADAAKFDSLPQGLQRNPGRAYTGVQQPFGHQGLPYEPEVGSYQNRARQYDTAKGRFVQRDLYSSLQKTDLIQATSQHLEIVNLYEYVNANPIAFSDPSGLIPCRHCPQVNPTCWSAASCDDRPVGAPCGPCKTCRAIFTCVIQACCVCD